MILRVRTQREIYGMTPLERMEGKNKRILIKREIVYQ